MHVGFCGPWLNRKGLFNHRNRIFLQELCAFGQVELGSKFNSEVMN